MGSLSLLQMLWFPALFVAGVLSWVMISIYSSIKRRSAARHTPSVIVQLPDDSDIVRNDGHNLDN